MLSNGKDLKPLIKEDGLTSEEEFEQSKSTARGKL
jgi:hypothetical protein